MNISKIVKTAIICSLGLILPVLGITLANVSADSDGENEKRPVLTIEAEQGSLSEVHRYRATRSEISENAEGLQTAR